MNNKDFDLSLAEVPSNDQVDNNRKVMFEFYDLIKDWPMEELEAKHKENVSMHYSYAVILRMVELQNEKKRSLYQSVLMK